MKEFLSEIEVLFVKKRALDVIYQYIRQQKQIKKRSAEIFGVEMKFFS